MNEIFKLNGVNFSYADRCILNGLSVIVEDGEVVCLLGPNGSGKTTLLKLMLGLLAPDSGSIYFNGAPLHATPQKLLARQLAYVPQVHRDAFTYTVEDVVLMGRLPYHSFFSTYTREDKLTAEAAMARLGISELRHRAYTEISGGERQLTLIARAMTQGAHVFIMDEPVNGLDYGNQVRLLSRIQKLAHEGYTFVITTHYPDHALHTASRAILLKDGNVVADGAPHRTITTKTIHELYAVDVSVVSVNGGGTVCLPAWRN